MVGLLLVCCWLVVWFVVDSSFILYGWRRPAPSAVWAQHRSRPAQIGKPRSAMPGLKTAARYGTIGGVPCRRHNRAPALTSSADTCRSAFSPAHGITSTSSGSNDFRRKLLSPDEVELWTSPEIPPQARKPQASTQSPAAAGEAKEKARAGYCAALRPADCGTPRIPLNAARFPA